MSRRLKKKMQKHMSLKDSHVDNLQEIPLEGESPRSTLILKDSEAGNDTALTLQKLEDKMGKLEKYLENISSLEDLLKAVNHNQQLLTKLQSDQEDSAKKEKAYQEEIARLRTEIALQNDGKVYRTYSYRLGHILIHSTKSWRNFCKLPSDLVQLYRDNKNRKLLKQNPQLNELKVPAIQKTVDSSVVDKMSKPTVEAVKKSAVTPRKLISSITPKNKNLRFISILDEISYVSWSYEFKLYEMSRTNFVEQISTSSSNGIFIESCWNGNFGNWLYAFTSPGLKHQNAQDLLKALDVAKQRDLPILFWNKEDPMHYEKFLPIAEKCDVIFTTDSNKIPDYQRDIPLAKVEALPFAANVHLCNPKDRFRNSNPGTICFAGSYYSVGHDDRKEQMDRLLPAIIECNGVIYDRMSNIEGDRYAYPSQYSPYIQPAVPFNEIIDVYKQFQIFLNVNTITDSPTMMSRRVYELLACGTPVISTPSLALEKQFPGIVQIANNAEEAVEIAKDLLSDEWKWARLSHLGYREVMLKHTYEHRTKQIAEAVGVVEEAREPLVTIAAVTNRPEFINRLAKNIREQSVSRLELIFVLQNYSTEQVEEFKTQLSLGKREYENIHIIIDESDTTLGARLNKAIEISKGDYLVKMDDDDFYFPNYIQDMLIPFSFGDYGIVGKKEIFIYLEENDATIVRYKNERHKETDFVAGATLVISRDALNKLEFGDKNRGEDTSLLNQAKEKRIKVYAADPFNFIVWRGKDKNKHTWQVDDEFFMKNVRQSFEGISERIARI